MRMTSYTLFVVAMTCLLATPTFAGHRWCCRWRSGSGSTTVTNNGGGGGSKGVSIKDANDSVSPEAAEAEAQAEFEQEFGERLLAALVAKVGRPLANQVLDDLANDLGAKVSGGIFGDDDPRPSTGAGDAAWQAEVRKLQGQINTINAHLGLTAGELGAQPALPGAGIDAKLRAIELAKQQEAIAIAALAEAQKRATAAQIETAKQLTAGQDALDAQLNALKAEMRKRLGDAPAAPAADVPALPPAPEPEPAPATEPAPAASDAPTAVPEAQPSKTAKPAK